MIGHSRPVYELRYDGDDFIELIDEQKKRAEDLRPVFRKAEKNLQASWIQNFTTQGSLVGGWKPLDAQYGAWKSKNYPGAPTLVQSGGLFRRLRNLDVRQINKRSATFGIRGEIAKFHQFGTWKMPERRIIFEPPMFARQLAEDAANYIEDGESWS